MKKFLAMLLAGTMLFSFAACGEDSEEKDNGKLVTEKSEKVKNSNLGSPEAAVEQYWLSIANGDYDTYLNVLAPEREYSKNRETFDGLHKGFDEDDVVEIEIGAVSYIEDFSGDYESVADVEYKMFVDNEQFFYDYIARVVKVDGEWKFLLSTVSKK